jgi:DNA transposition AAA+ family ATPase
MKDNDVGDSVKNRLREHLSATGISQAQAAKKIGVGQTLLCKYLNNRYSKKQQSLEAAINRYLEVEAARKKGVNLLVDYVETTQGNMCMSVMQYCHLRKKIGLLISEAGLGKTLTMSHYALTNRNAMLITSYAGIFAENIMEKILEYFGVHGQRNTENSKMEAVIKRLTGGDYILLFDECQHWNTKHIEKVRHLHDVTHAGVVIAGNNIVVRRMKGDDFVMFDQLFSRVAIKADLTTKVKRQDVRSILTGMGMNNLDDACVDFLREIGERKGHYRQMYHVLEMATAMSQRENEPIDLQRLMTAKSLCFNVEE